MPRKASDPKPAIVWQRDYDTDVHGNAKMHWTVIDGGNTSRSVLISKSLMHKPSELRAILADHMAALPVEPADALAIVNAALALGARDKTIGKLTGQTGWYPSDSRLAFVLPAKTLGDQNIVHASRLAGDAPLVSSAGSLKDWRKGLKKPCRSSRFLVFALSVAFAGPTLRFYPGGKGLLFNFSGETGAGKTSLLEAALSAVKSPKALESTEITHTGLEEKSRETNDLILCLDEFGAALSTPKQAAALIHMLAYQTREGRGRRRSSAGQKALGYDHATWAIAVLTSSENTLDAMMGDEKREAGAQMRYVDIAVPLPDVGGCFPALYRKGKEQIEPPQLADLLQSTIEKNFGIALPEFVSALIGDPRVQSKLASYQTEFAALLRRRSPAQQSRYFENFAKVFAAGRVAAELKIAPFNVQQISDATIALFDASALVKSASSARSIEGVSNLIEIGNDPNRCPIHFKGKPLDNVDGRYRAVRFCESGRDWLFVPTSWLKSVLPKGLAEKAFIQELDGIGILSRGGNSATKQHSVTGLVTGNLRPYGYQFDWEKLQAFHGPQKA